MISGTETIEGVRPGTYPDESLIGKINVCGVVHHDYDPSLVGESASLDAPDVLCSGSMIGWYQETFRDPKGQPHQRRHFRLEVEVCRCCGEPIFGDKTGSWFSLCAECLTDVMADIKDKT